MLAVNDDEYLVSLNAAVLNAVYLGQEICLELLLELVKVLGIVFRRLRAGVVIAQRSLRREAKYEKHDKIMRNTAQPTGFMAFTKLSPAVMMPPPDT